MQIYAQMYQNTSGGREGTGTFKGGEKGRERGRKGSGESPLQGGFVGRWGGCRMNTVYQYSTREQVLGDGNTERAGLPGRSGYVVCLQVSYRPHVTFIFIYIHEATYAATTITGNLT